MTCDAPEHGDDHAGINAAIDEYATTTLYSRDTLQTLAMNHPDVGEFRFIVEAFASGMTMLPPDRLAELYRNPVGVKPIDGLTYGG